MELAPLVDVIANLMREMVTPVKTVGITMIGIGELGFAEHRLNKNIWIDLLKNNDKPCSLMQVALAVPS
jgi:hypothetical protein